MNFNIRRKRIPVGKTVRISRGGNAFHVARYMRQIVDQAVKDPRLIEFVRRHPMDEKQIFRFVYFIASFKPDKKNDQVIKTPFATMRTHRANCVCYSVLIAALLKLNGINGFWRMIRETNNILTPYPKHIYPISENGKVMDCVLGQDQERETSRADRENKIGFFDKEVKYFSKFDEPF